MICSARSVLCTPWLTPDAVHEAYAHCAHHLPSLRCLDYTSSCYAKLVDHQQCSLEHSSCGIGRRRVFSLQFLAVTRALQKVCVIGRASTRVAALSLPLMTFGPQISNMACELPGERQSCHQGAASIRTRDQQQQHSNMRARQSSLEALSLWGIRKNAKTTHKVSPTNSVMQEPVRTKGSKDSRLSKTRILTRN